MKVAFAMERHLGHRTYYENLRAHVDEAGIEPTWIPVDYEVPAAIERVPMPSAARPALAGRLVVRRGLAAAGADVHVFNTQVPAVLAGRRARSRPYVVITDVTPRQYDRMADGYGHRADRSGPTAWVKHRANCRTFANASWCVGWSQWACDSMVREYGVRAERTRVIPPGVDTDVWSPGEERDDAGFRLLFVGGEFSRKGGEHLLNAFRTLPGDTELVIVTRSELPAIERATVVNDLVPNDSRLIELYRSSHVFVLPTLAETFGIAAAEAAASGLPVVASDVGGLSEIVEHGTTGFTLPPGDEDALAGALRDLYDRDLRRRMGAAARRRAEERLDAKTNAQRLLELVNDAAERPVPSRSGG